MKFADVVDEALEITIVPSFTRIGPAVRSRLDHWHTPLPATMTGRVVVVTGATSGLGLTAAGALATAGATVEIIARNATKAEAVCAQLRADAPGATVAATIADTGDLDALREAARQLRERHDRIDALVHNAGALDPTRAVAPCGIEQTVASQVVGPFLLSALLYEPLVQAAPGRIVWVSSGGMYTEPLAVDRLEMPASEYRGTVAYSRAKRAQVTLAEMMAARVDATRLVVQAMHPGWALTPGVERSLPTFRKITGPLLRSPEQGADTLLWLTADDGEPIAHTGGFWLDRRRRPLHKRRATRASDTTAERTHLWEWVAAAAGTDFPPTATSER